jgi:hypothetical protein
MSEPPPQDEGRRFLGALLIGAGCLIAGLGGLCTLFVAGMDAAEGGIDEFVLLALLIGAVPVAVGGTLIFLGRHLRRPRG